MSTKAARLKARAQAAADVRRYDTDPDVVAYRLERRSSLGTGLIWAGIVLGLAFTVPNVQQFVAGDAPEWSITWTTAWLLDVMVSLPLIGVLILEQATTKHEVALGSWARVLKWGSLSATYAMNTWHSWAHLDAPGILVHSVPPLMVFVCAEVLPDGRDRVTKAVAKARRTVAVGAPESAPQAAPKSASGGTEPLPPALEWVRVPADAVVLPIVARTTPKALTAAPESAQRSTAEQAKRHLSAAPRRERADKGTRVPPAARKSAAEPGTRVLSDEELAERLATLRAVGELPADASVRQIQAALGVGFERAKRVLALAAKRAAEAAQEHEEAAA